MGREPLKRCDRCELPVGQGCGCDLPGPGAPRSTRDHAEPIRRAKFAPDTILISPRQMAHLPEACGYLTESNMTTPAWGWIPNPDPGLWDRISAAYPVRATEGDRRLTAIIRCSECSSNV